MVGECLLIGGYGGDSGLRIVACVVHGRANSQLSGAWRMYRCGGEAGSGAKERPRLYAFYAHQLATVTFWNLSPPPKYRAPAAYHLSAYFRCGYEQAAVKIL